MSQTNLVVLSHWGALVENLEVSPKAFYKRVEEAVKKREIPDLSMERVYWKESGFLSADREYLRVMRGRYMYDICAAPFGTGFFFSSWMAEKMPSPLWAIVGLLLLPFVTAWVFIIFVYWFGTFGFLMWCGGVVAGVTSLVLLLSKDESQFAEYIFVVPYIGQFLERICRPNTYFRSDTEAMFRTMTHNAVLEAVDAITKAKGSRELTGDERKPILRDFFKP